MRVLFVGDVVGPRAVDWLAARLVRLRAENDVDLIVVDAENCAADAASMSVDLVEMLLEAGADVITGGNHAFEGAEVDAVLGHERVLRPLNVADGVPGRGAMTIPVAGEDVRVVVLADRFALDVAPAFARMTVEPYAAWASPSPSGMVPRPCSSRTAQPVPAQSPHRCRTRDGRGTRRRTRSANRRPPASGSSTQPP